MSLLLADARIGLYILDALPEDLNALETSDFTNADNIADRTFLDDTYVRPTGSDTINKALLNGTNKSSFGASNYEGQLMVARFLDPETGLPEEDDDLWEQVKKKGTQLVLGWRVGPEWDAEIEDGQEFSIFEVTTDTPQPSTEDYVRFLVPLAVKSAWTNRVVGSEEAPAPGDG